MNVSPLVSIIIPHWRGEKILLRALQSLQEHTHLPHEIIVVDNGCDDGSIALAHARFPHAIIIATGKNLGFASGCNFGLRVARGKYVALFNNDAVTTPHWLEPMIELMENDASLAACQPKILSLLHDGYFDYAGAAGGMIDFLGYPFCRGRIFSTIEKDRGQYDETAEIFWASGACCLLRKSVLDEIGLLDDAFFAHMEEIDLNWRMHLAGYRVMAAPQARVYHQAGSTLHQAAPYKTYLNHRNGLFLLLKNYEPGWLWPVFALRLVLDVIEALRLLVTLRPRHAFMILRASVEVLWRLPELWRKRRKSRLVCRIANVTLRRKLYPRSVIWDYFIRRRTRCSELSFMKFDDHVR
jgi:GT2 family glycosyltransferase